MKRTRVRLTLVVVVALASLVVVSSASAAPTLSGYCVQSLGSGKVYVKLRTKNAGAAQARIVVGSSYQAWQNLASAGTQTWDPAAGYIRFTASTNARVDYHIGNSAGWTSGTLRVVDSVHVDPPCG